MPPKTPTRRRSSAIVVSDSDSERKPSTPTTSKSSSNGFFSAGGGGGGGGGSASGERSQESAVRVVVRFRPQNKKEIDEGGKVCVSFPSEDSIEVNDSTKTYDRVFDPSATQQQVFDYVAKPLVEDLLSGYNGTIFAYGQTSSGKTHTMEGPSIHDKDLAGVIPRTVRQIFFLVAEAPENVEFVIKVSYIEIYMEKIRDLLDIYHTKVNLPVREEKSRGVYVAGATEEYVTSAEELISIMGAGAKNRAVAATGMNQGSSRSHSVFIISVQQRNVNDSSTKTGMLYLVDLAGSEMVKKTHATGQVLNEAKTINKSLSALGQVINALTDDKKPHVPYRDSKLTRVLQNSLGGNSKTCLIVNCSPSSFNELETVSTLRFGSRAKRIQNKAVVNETRSVEELGALLIKAESAFDLQQTYIAALEKQLKAYRNKNRAAEPPRPPQVSNDGGEKEKGGDGTRSPPDRARQDEESANAIRRLTKRNQELQQDLEEEKAEVKRREQVSNELRQVLAEKERLLLEAANLFREAESVHAAREEAASSEKADVETELEAMRTLMQETGQRHQFDHDEMTLKVEKLSGENARLAEELREITGDDLPEVTVTGNTSSASSRPQATRPRPSSPPSPSPKAPTAIPASETSQDTTSVDSNIDGPMSETPPPSTETAVAQAGGVEVAVAAEVEKPGDPELTGGVAVSKESRGRSARGEGLKNGERLPPEGFVPAEEMETFDFSALQGAGAPEEAMAMVADREERWRERETTMIAEQWKYMTRAQQLMAEREVRERQLECNQQNCEQLAQDLQNSERRREREQEQTAAASYPGGVELERLKRETILLQQRLAQLSEVHRRLLWKFGQVESERSESDKKVRNRDVLIKQLEQDYVAAVMKHKTQKEDYTKKLLVFRQEVAKLEQEAQRQKSMPSAQSHLERRAVRGGGGNHHAQEVKTLRGGAGRRPPDDAQPWGGLGYDVQSNTYASEQAGGVGSGSSASGVQRIERTDRTDKDAAEKRRSMGTPGRPRGESFLERFLGPRAASTAGTPLPPKFSSSKPGV